MKFILSFVIATTILSAETSFKLSLGNAALTPAKLCAPVTIFTPPTPIQCPLPTLQIPTQLVIKCDLPTVVPTPAPILTKCTTATIICPTPTAPVIDCPKAPTTIAQCDPATPTSATPEPASYALLGAGLVTVGFARKFSKK